MAIDEAAATRLQGDHVKRVAKTGVAERSHR